MGGILSVAKIKVKCNIGYLLEKEGRTQSWLAKQIGASKQQMNNWCSEDGSIPNIGYIMRIQKATGWRLEEMFEEE